MQVRCDEGIAIHIGPESCEVPVRASAKIDGHDHQLREALAIAETLAREGKLTAAQQGWPRAMRDMLAKLPPEQAGAQ